MYTIWILDIENLYAILNIAMYIQYLYYTILHINIYITIIVI